MLLSESWIQPEEIDHLSPAEKSSFHYLAKLLIFEKDSTKVIHGLASEILTGTELPKHKLMARRLELTLSGENVTAFEIDKEKATQKVQRIVVTMTKNQTYYPGR